MLCFKTQNTNTAVNIKLRNQICLIIMLFFVKCIIEIEQFLGLKTIHVTWPRKFALEVTTSSVLSVSLVSSTHQDPPFPLYSITINNHFNGPCHPDSQTFKFKCTVVTANGEFATSVDKTLDRKREVKEEANFAREEKCGPLLINNSCEATKGERVL